MAQSGFLRSRLNSWRRRRARSRAAATRLRKSEESIISSTSRSRSDHEPYPSPVIGQACQGESVFRSRSKSRQEPPAMPLPAWSRATAVLPPSVVAPPRCGELRALALLGGACAACLCPELPSAGGLSPRLSCEAAEADAVPESAAGVGVSPADWGASPG